VQSKWGSAGRHFAVLRSTKLAVKEDSMPFGALKAGQVKVSCVDVFPLDAGLLARGPATGHLDTGFSWFPRVFNL
jgi:hypothetical protein